MLDIVYYVGIYRGQYCRLPNTVDIARCPNHERGYGRCRPHVHIRFVVLIIIVITDACTHMGWPDRYPPGPNRPVRCFFSGKTPTHTHGHYNHHYYHQNHQHYLHPHGRVFYFKLINFFQGQKKLLWHNNCSAQFSIHVFFGNGHYESYIYIRIVYCYYFNFERLDTKKIRKTIVSKLDKILFSDFITVFHYFRSYSFTL